MVYSHSCTHTCPIRASYYALTQPSRLGMSLHVTWSALHHAGQARRSLPSVSPPAVHACVRVQVGADEVLTRLQHFLWIKPGPADQRRLCLYAPEDTTCEADTHTHLLTLLAVLRAVRLAYPSQLDETTEVVLHKWPITHEVMHALQGLPAWDAALTFQECKWPLAHPEYKQLATCVPTLYWKWNLGFQWPCVRRVESIIGGLESHRSPASLRDMTVTVQNRKAVRAVETRARVGEHVYLHHVDD